MVVVAAFVFVAPVFVVVDGAVVAAVFVLVGAAVFAVGAAVFVLAGFAVVTAALVADLLAPDPDAAFVAVAGAFAPVADVFVTVAGVFVAVAGVLVAEEGVPFAAGLFAGEAAGVADGLAVAPGEPGAFCPTAVVVRADASATIWISFISVPFCLLLKTTVSNFFAPDLLPVAPAVPVQLQPAEQLPAHG